MKYSRGRTLLALALTGIVLPGCAEAPTVEIAAADSAMAAILASGAEEYAPASWGSVNDLRSQLEAEMTIQSEKFAMTRSYDHVMELATQVRAASEEAASETAIKKEEVRLQTMALFADVRLALTDIQQMLTTAPRGKGSAMDLAALQVDLDAAVATFAEGEAAINEGRYMDANAKVLAAQSGADGVRSAIEAAIQGKVIKRGQES